MTKVLSSTEIVLAAEDKINHNLAELCGYNTQEEFEIAFKHTTKDWIFENLNNLEIVIDPDNKFSGMIYNLQINICRGEFELALLEHKLQYSGDPCDMFLDVAEHFPIRSLMDGEEHRRCLLFYGYERIQQEQFVPVLFELFKGEWLQNNAGLNDRGICLSTQRDNWWSDFTN